jgi:Arc/MetJ-type ribon-helix-helix transcriptional regulator
MVRTQIQLSEEQARALKDLAAKYHVSMAELIRQAVDDWLRSADTVDREERKRRAIAAAGRFRSELTDLSTAHDRYLVEAFEE